LDDKSGDLRHSIGQVQQAVPSTETVYSRTFSVLSKL
jgi:hypothetical protein